MKDYDSDIPKYKKKSSAKHIPRSDHKHNYGDCLLVDNENRPYNTAYSSTMKVSFYDERRSKNV